MSFVDKNVIMEKLIFQPLFKTDGRHFGAKILARVLTLLAIPNFCPNPAWHSVWGSFLTLRGKSKISLTYV